MNIPACVIAALLLLAHPAYAAEPTPAEVFQQRTTEAESAHAGGRFDEAVARYLEAYQAVPSPDVLYNVGYIYEVSLKKPDLASDFYRRVVRDSTSRPDLVKLATERIAIIDAAAAANTVRPNVLTETPPDNVGGKVVVGEESSSAAPWVLVGIGGAAIVSGLVVGLAASSAHGDFEDRVGGLKGMRDNADSGKTLSVASDVLWIGGSALALTGIIWLLAEDDAPAPRTGVLQLSPSVAPSGAGLTLTGGF